MELPRDATLETRDHVLGYTASELQEAEVNFKASTSKCLLDVEFSGHVLDLPQILLVENTEIELRNIIALGQPHYPSKCYITDHSFLFDCLIDTDKEVDILFHENIIQSYLNDAKKVAAVFNGLGTNAVQVNFNSRYLDICKRLNGFVKILDTSGWQF